MSLFVDRVRNALQSGDALLISRVEDEVSNAFLVSSGSDRLILDGLLSVISRSRLSLPVSDKWLLIPSFVKSRGLIRHHIESFDRFVDSVMPSIMAAFGEVRCKANTAWVCRFLSIRLGEPSLEAHGLTEASTKVTPQVCRISDCTYSAPILVRIEYSRAGSPDGLFRPEEELELGRMPIMLRSKHCVLHGKSEQELMRLGECPLDPGGYFIVRGVERLILMQEQLAFNRLIVLSEKGMLRAEIQSFSVQAKSRVAVLLKRGLLFLHHNSFNEDIPLCIALLALGVESMGQMADLIGTEPFLRELLRPSFTSVALMSNVSLVGQEDALHWIGTKIRSRFAATSSTLQASPSPESAARSFFERSLLCHLQGEQLGSLRAKACFLGLMARRVLLALHSGEHSDSRDFYGNKRVDLAGDMMALLFEVVFRQAAAYVSQKADAYFRKAAQMHVHVVDLPKDVVSSGLRQAIATGNWRSPRVNVDRAGVSQVVSRLSYMSAFGMLGRIRSNFEKTRKQTGPRALQPSQWGVVCPSDTPEGESCGLVKNLALITHVSQDHDPGRLIELVLTLGTENVCLLRGGDAWRSGLYVVFVNGVLVGVHSQPGDLAGKLRQLRRAGELPFDVSVAVSETHKSVTVLSDSGRLCRPLLVVDQQSGKCLFQPRHCEELARGVRSFDLCVAEGLVEFLDVSEEDDCLIALKDEDIVAGKTTHVEIDPMTILGVLAGLIPYPHHNQSPRNTYQCAMGKQAMGIYATNQLRRVDGSSYMLVYSQKPLVKTKTLDLIGFDQIPAGHNAIIAVMSFTGYDIEDAVILNRASVDRGFGRCLYSSTVTDVVHASDADKSETRGAPSARNSHLDPEDGLVCRGTKVARDAVLAEKRVGMDKTTVLKNKSSGEGVVHQVYLTVNADGENIAKIKIVETRTPELGDKFSSRHGQKGVVGLIVPQEDMPFSDQGLVPDLVMNPHGFPSRMTVGKLLELLGSKAAVLDGRFRDGTAFAGDSLKSLSQALVKNGFHYQGKDYLTSGLTGEPLPAFVFFGPVYYQKLKHMVYQKMQVFFLFSSHFLASGLLFFFFLFFFTITKRHGRRVRSA